MKGVIYKITNIKNNKFYVGSTIDFKRRKTHHLSNLRNGKHVNKYLQNAFNKYGEDSFKIEVIDKGENIKDKEQGYLDRIDFDNSYNICKFAHGGDVIKDFPKERREAIYDRIRKARTGKKATNRVKISINDIMYQCYKDAFEALNIPVPTIRNRCHSLNIKYKDWFVIGQEKDINQLYKENVMFGINIICEGREFESYREAARELTLSYGAIRNRVLSSNYPNYYKLNA